MKRLEIVGNRVQICVNCEIETTGQDLRYLGNLGTSHLLVKMCKSLSHNPCTIVSLVLLCLQDSLYICIGVANANSGAKPFPAERVWIHWRTLWQLDEIHASKNSEGQTGKPPPRHHRPCRKIWPLLRWIIISQWSSIPSNHLIYCLEAENKKSNEASSLWGRDPKREMHPSWICTCIENMSQHEALC